MKNMMSVAKAAPDTTGRLAELARNRIAIEAINIDIDGGRFRAKAIAGRPLEIEADIFGDGHDVLAAAVLYKMNDTGDWLEAPLEFVDNDRWGGQIIFPEIGTGVVRIIAWRDVFATWRRDTGKKIAASLPVSTEVLEGLQILAQAAAGRDGSELAGLSTKLSREPLARQLDVLMSDETAMLVERAQLRVDLSQCDRDMEMQVERPIAAFSAWYEMMPRSQSAVPGRHGTFSDVIERLPYVRDLGFDVLYFTPIHPIGVSNRKGRNNSLKAGPDDPGSPYAIGSKDGGHDAVHPELGTLDDFRALVKAAAEFGLEIALDFAIQCSPDHPWIREHPDWFDWRPDGTIKYAENPPKKYEDIVNVHFYGKAVPDLWIALRDVVLFWIEQGVLIFRVDNPHTKPFPFWEWMIADVRARHPGVVFLAEAFTRPKVMKRLAKVGFAQSYSYFTWRNEKAELIEYLEELTAPETRDVMRPNFFANTPDINPIFLQTSGRPGFRIRLALAATLGGNYGIYNGYEICDAAPVPGKEEYLNSEKYELRQWDFDAEGHIKDDIRLLNRLRREHPAMSQFASLKFHPFGNDQVLYYAKSDPASGSYLLFHVLLDPHNAQEGTFELPLWEFGLPDDGAIDAQDLLHGNHFTWHGKYHTLRLDPHERPYAIWRLFPQAGAQT